MFTPEFNICISQIKEDNLSELRYLFSNDIPKYVDTRIDFYSNWFDITFIKNFFHHKNMKLFLKNFEQFKIKPYANTYDYLYENESIVIDEYYFIKFANYVKKNNKQTLDQFVIEYNFNDMAAFGLSLFLFSKLKLILTKKALDFFKNKMFLKITEENKKILIKKRCYKHKNVLGKTTCDLILEYVSTRF